MLFSIKGVLERRTYALLSIAFIPINGVLLWLLGQIPTDLGLPNAILTYPDLPGYVLSWSNFGQNLPLRLFQLMAAPLIWAAISWKSLAVQPKRLRAIGSAFG